MPRKSAASLAIISPDPSGTGRRLVPPDSLSAAAREVFLGLVGANEPRHFTKSDLPLLVAYSTACSLERQAAEALEREGLVVAGRANPWLVVQEKQVRAMTALSMRLRLAPQSRIDARAAGRTARATPQSAYEQMETWNE